MTENGFGTIVQIGDILVSEDVVCEFFACDYPRCKGICCIEGDSGAPLEERELDALESNWEKVRDEVSPGGREAVGKEGFFSIDREGDLVTPLVGGSAECAYCCKTSDGAFLCAIEKLGLKKPISCSLYPIRVTRLTGGGKALNLHRWKICECAFEKGRREGIRVYEFLEKPLREEFSDEFYQMLEAAAKHINGQNGE